MSEDNHGVKDFDFEYSTDKTKIFRSYCLYTFTRLKSMFVYTGLPDTIPAQWLEEYLTKNGQCCIAQIEGNLYALLGTAGGERDIYYQPTRYVVSNPALPGSKKSYDFEIGTDCVYARNDYSASGLVPLVSRYCGLMTENYVTTRVADINMRMAQIMSAPDDATAASAKQYLKDIEAGKLGVIGEMPFFEGLKVQTAHTSGNDYMIQFIELAQFLKGSMYNELGLDANYNMKREALSTDEIALNDDALMPLIDDMLKERRAMCEKIEELFGVHVEVDYGSSWHANTLEKTASLQSALGANTEMASSASDETGLPSDADPNQEGQLVDESSQLEAGDNASENEDVNNEVEGVQRSSDSGDPGEYGGDSNAASDGADGESQQSIQQNGAEHSNDQNSGDDSRSEEDSESSESDDSRNDDTIVPKDVKDKEKEKEDETT